MADVNILISVLPEPGSGISHGKFMENGKMKNPKKFQSDDPSVHSTYYSAHDFYVGSILEINIHAFLLTSADEYVFDFMERNDHREQFAHSNIRVILDKTAANLGKSSWNLWLALCKMISLILEVLENQYLEESQNLWERTN